MASLPDVVVGPPARAIGLKLAPIRLSCELSSLIAAASSFLACLKGEISISSANAKSLRWPNVALFKRAQIHCRNDIMEKTTTTTITTQRALYPFVYPAACNWRQIERNKPSAERRFVVACFASVHLIQSSVLGGIYIMGGSGSPTHSRLASRFNSASSN